MSRRSKRYFLSTIAAIGLWMMCASTAWARTSAVQKGLVEVRPGERLYVEYRPAKLGHPTLFLLNGLTYTTDQWAGLVASLRARDPDLGLVVYDMKDMGKTLEADLLDRPTISEVSLPDQVRDLKDLVRYLDIRGPISMAGLSYGGAVALLYGATHPEDFDQIIAISPYLSRLPGQDALIKYYVQWHRRLYPWDLRSDEQLYNMYLQIIVYGTYPLAEPVVLKNPFYLQGIYKLVLGAKSWDVKDVTARLPKGKVHLISGEKDQYVSLAEQTAFWQDLAPDVRASRLIVEDTLHKVPWYLPDLTAKWLLRILNKDPELQKGLTFRMNPVTGRTCETEL